MTIYKDQLRAVYKLIERPETWTQGAYARNKRGDLLDENGDEVGSAELQDAACWCILGAGYKCGIMERALRKACGTDELDVFNDTHTHAEVLALLRSAIDRAPERKP